jgi:hypothetical protein
MVSVVSETGGRTVKDLPLAEDVRLSIWWKKFSFSLVSMSCVCIVDLEGEKVVTVLIVCGEGAQALVRDFFPC